ncbi:MAG: PAS domain S-box protein, partial [bacterium]|nr:PAS domain S-box protein [bacterium]
MKSINFTPPEYSARFEKLYTTLLDAIPSSLLLVDQNMRIVSANRNFLEKSRLTLENTIGQRLERVFPDVIREQIDINKRIRQVFEHNKPLMGERMTYRAPGVPIRIYYYSILPLSWQGVVDSALLLMDDVTEQVRLSEEVRRVERHLASIVESASDIVLSTDVQGKILSWNSAAERLSGYTNAEAIGRYFFDFCMKEDKREVRNIFVEIGTRNQSQSQMKETALMTKEDSAIPVYWVFSPLRGEANQTLGVVAVGRDLAERRKLEMRLLQSQKLTSLGIMAGGIAHEIRNPLAICSSSAQFLLDDMTPELRKECAEKICSSIRRTSTIIENLLKFAHPFSNTDTKLVNLVSLIQETMTLVNYHARSQQIETSMDFTGDAIMVQGVA